MIYELHITTHPGVDVESWVDVCSDLGAKPLHIELVGGGLDHPAQLMNAMVSEHETELDALAWTDWLAETIEYIGFPIVRKKLEVPLDKSADFDEPVYHEAHVKSLIPKGSVQSVISDAEKLGWVASKNLLYPEYDGCEKWYLTKREYVQGYRAAGNGFSTAYGKLQGWAFHLVRMEMETVVLDTNPELDAGWA